MLRDQIYVLILVTQFDDLLSPISPRREKKKNKVIEDLYIFVSILIRKLSGSSGWEQSDSLVGFGLRHWTCHTPKAESLIGWSNRWSSAEFRLLNPEVALLLDHRWSQLNMDFTFKLDASASKIALGLNRAVDKMLLVVMCKNPPPP